MNPYLGRATRSLEDYLADLVEQLKLLPPQSKARPALINRIRQVEAELDARQPI